MANEKRLIDANALLAELDKFASPMPNKSGYDFLCGMATAITEIENAPTVDTVEVVHAKAVPIYSNVEHGDTLIRMDSQCPLCGALMLKVDNYCPNCGAKMDGDGNV